MLTAIVRFSLRHRAVVIALACIFFVYGLYALSHAGTEVFPEFAPPQVVIQTEAAGLSPEQVEVLVTLPVENAINGATAVDMIRSTSIQGLSAVTVTFQPGSDIYRARQAMTERLATLAGRLPQGVASPVMTPLTSSTATVLSMGLTSDTRTLMELRTLADWTIKPRLLAAPGVASVTVFGGDVKQIQIQVRPERLIHYGLSIEDVLSAAQRFTGVRGAGFIDLGGRRIVLKTEGQTVDVKSLANSALVLGNGSDVTLSISLGDVADVIEAPEPPIGAASIMGKGGVILIVMAQMGANTLEVTGAVEAALEELRPSLESQGVILRADLFRPANFILAGLRNIRSSLWLGALLVVVVLFLFLMNIRTALISCAAIPLSLLAAVVVLQRFGLNLNAMTIGGLAISVGLVVDDAIIDVENILRRLRENDASPSPKPASQVTLDASLEVRNAVVYATLAVALVFIPVLTLSGVAGRLFAPLGIAYILATLASLVVALTVTPALCLVLIGRPGIRRAESALVRLLKDLYRAILIRVERRHILVIVFVVALTFAAAYVLRSFRGEFLPELREDSFIVHMLAPPGTSLTEAQEIGRQATEAILALPYVRSVAQQLGRAQQGEDAWGTHYSEFVVGLKAGTEEQAERAQDEIRAALSNFSGTDFDVQTFLSERIEETVSGFTAAVAVSVYGNDLDALDSTAAQITRALGEISGAADVRLQSPSGIPELSIRLRPDELTRWGFDAVDVLDAVRLAYQGTAVGQIYDGNRVFDLAVILSPRDRNSVEAVGNLPLRSPSCSFVRLRQVADVSLSSGRYSIEHIGARRVQTVTCNVSGRDVVSFVAEAKRRISADMRLPAGSYVEFTGEAEAQSRARRDLLMHSLLALGGIVVLLSMVIDRPRHLLLILLNAPFALVGGVAAAALTGGELTLGSMVGFVTLFGITLRNSIMMISHYEHLVTVENVPWGLETAIRGAAERLAPILMTSLVTGLGLLPLAIHSESAGQEIEGPMAIVILGGLITSTALNLLVMPALALHYGGTFRKKDD